MQSNGPYVTHMHHQPHTIYESNRVQTTAVQQNPTIILDQVYQTPVMRQTV
jgi:hypothetical protein